eukprot:s392_g38.t1
MRRVLLCCALAAVALVPLYFLMKAPESPEPQAPPSWTEADGEEAPIEAEGRSTGGEDLQQPCHDLGFGRLGKEALLGTFNGQVFERQRRRTRPAPGKNNRVVRLWLGVEGFFPPRA